jgi:FMN phosphatase YigB (HAD superfamily)
VLLYRQAVDDHGVDPARALFVGDRWRDVAPAIALGGTGVLVPGPITPPEEIERARREAAVAESLGAAIRQHLSLT